MTEISKKLYDEETGFLDFNEVDFDHLEKPDGMDDDLFKKTLFCQSDNDNIR